MKRRFAVLAVVLLLVLLAGTQATTPHAVTSASAPGTWWNTSYRFRLPVTVVNGGSTPFVNQTVMVHVNFTQYQAQDPLASARLVDASGNEIPSVLVGAQFSGAFLLSAYLLFSASIPAGSAQLYYVYYGGLYQTVPSYRTSQPSNSLSSGFMNATLQALTFDSSRLRLGFGTVDTESTMTKVSYTLGGQEEYGPTVISRQPFSNDTGLVLAGQIGSGSTIAYETTQAGAVQLTRILVLSTKGALTIDAVENGASSAVSSVQLTSLIGLGGLTNSGISTSAYDIGAQLLYTQNPDGYFVVGYSPSPVSFTLGSTDTVTSEALSGTFPGVSSYNLASAAGFTWSLGDLEPGAATWASSSWGVASSLGQLVANLPPLPSGANLGKAEVLSNAAPQATSLWSARAVLTNVSIPATGLVVPFGIGRGVLSPGASSITGTYTYSFPPLPQDDPRAWSSTAVSTGNATSFASSQYYDFGTGQDVARLLTYIPRAGSSSAASLISTGGFTVGGTNAALQIRYLASFSTVSGDFSAQNFFIAADFDPTLSGNYSESILLPVSGSSTVLPVSGCDSSASQTVPASKGLSTGLLIGDGTWRTLSIALPSSLPTSGFDARLRFCIFASPGFVGQMNLEVASAGVVHSGSVSSVIEPTFSHTAPEVTLGYLPQAQSMATAGVTANLTISLAFQANCSVGWADGSTFSGYISPPSSFSIGDSTLRKSAALGVPRLDGVLIISAVSQYAESGKVNGTAASVSSDPGIAFLGAAGSGTGVPPVPFALALRSEPLEAVVVDQDHVGVPGALVVPSVGGVSLPVTLLTNASGGAQFLLVPWSFRFNATYQGYNVGTAETQVGTQTTLPISTSLYQLTLLVKDARGGAIAGAQIALTIGNYSYSGSTDNQGRYSFEGVANALYGLTVTVGGVSYFTGEVDASANNAVIQVTTSYLPPSTELTIAVLLAIIPVALIVAYLIARRLRPSR